MKILQWFMSAMFHLWLPRWLSSKESACQCRRLELVSGQEDRLEKEMPIQSSILAWEIPWTEEPGGALCGAARLQAPKEGMGCALGLASHSEKRNAEEGSRGLALSMADLGSRTQQKT